MDKSKIMFLIKTETVHKDTVHHGCPANSLPNCIMQPVATSVAVLQNYAIILGNYVYHFM